MDDVDPTRIDLPATPDGGDATQVHEVQPGWGADEPPVGPPPREPLPAPDRRPWIVAALLGLIVLILILILVFNSDDNDDAATSDTTTSLVTTTTATVESTTTEASTTTKAPTSTTSPVVTVPPDDCADFGKNSAQPGRASDTVYEAWTRGDKACAATLMTPAALDELFSRDGTGAQDDFQGCTNEDLPDDQADCAYTYEGGATHYLMNYTNAAGWKVFDITQVAD